MTVSAACLGGVSWQQDQKNFIVTKKQTNKKTTQQKPHL